MVAPGLSLKKAWPLLPLQLGGYIKDPAILLVRLHRHPGEETWKNHIKTEAQCLDHVANFPSDPHRTEGLMKPRSDLLY